VARSRARAIRVLLGFLAVLMLEAFLMVAEAERAVGLYVGATSVAVLALSIRPSRLTSRWRRWMTDDYPQN
jgi:hypothetical protein